MKFKSMTVEEAQADALRFFGDGGSARVIEVWAVNKRVLAGEMLLPDGRVTWGVTSPK